MINWFFFSICQNFENSEKNKEVTSAIEDDTNTMEDSSDILKDIIDVWNA